MIISPGNLPKGIFTPFAIKKAAKMSNSPIINNTLAKNLSISHIYFKTYTFFNPF